MAFIPTPVRPTRAFADLRDFLGQPGRHKLVFAVLSLTLTIGLIAAVWKQFESKREYVEPDIVYVKQWSAGRTRLEIVQQQARDLPAERAAKAAYEKALAVRRAQFKRVGDMMGIDTDAK